MNDALSKKLRKNTEVYYRDILGLPDWPARTDGRMARQYEAHMFQRLVKFAGPLDGKTVLDLGCGWGGVVLHAAGPAQVAVGVEPDLERLAIATELLRESGQANAKVLPGVGEQLPFDNNSFDVVASYQVLEHVQDPAKVVAEVARVLRPGGMFHFSTPNYLAFWEPHYKIFWLPLMPKWLGRLYLTARGRDTKFLQHLHYVNPLNVRKLLREQNLKFVDLHYQSACAKLEIILNGWFSRLPGWSALSRLVRPVTDKIIFLIHTCFVNKDQEYLAIKV